jgi:hypothetical protein
MEDLLRCRVCGFKHYDFPWGADGKTPSFEICECCGTEFGYEDYQLGSIHKARAEWIAEGARWAMPISMPIGWKLEEQIAAIPESFK